MKYLSCRNCLLEFFYDEQGIVILDRLRVLPADLDDLAAEFGLDLVHQLHRLNNTEYLSLLHNLSDLDIRRRVGRRSAIESADYRRSDPLSGLIGSCYRSRSRG